MSDGGLGFSEWHNHTYLHPLGLVATLALGIAVLLVPRHYAIAPLIVLACLIPSAQRLVVMGADFTLLRILVIFAWLRILLRSEFRGVIWNRLDTMLMAWMIGGAIIYVVREGTFGAVINRSGWLLDGLGMYFFFRCVIRTWRDLRFLVLTFVYVSFPVAVAFLIERATGKNLFSVLGGVPVDTVVRGGRLRCQGAFSHAILAGCFWVTVMPWVLAETVSRNRWIAWAGFVGCLVIMVNCASSTPLLAFAIMLVGWGLYPIRAQLRLVRGLCVVAMLFLHFIMDKPIWHIIARVNVVGGSTGWHRFKIMDATIENFSEWWLVGERDPMSWGVWEMRDITNQYILEALRGGLLGLTCFVVMIGVAFGILGKILRETSLSKERRIIVWSIGIALFTQSAVFFSVSYFGQIIMVWYLTLAMVGSLALVTSEFRDAPGTDSVTSSMGRG